MLKFLNSRRFRQGSIATAFTAVVIAVIVVFNMLVSTLSAKYSLNIDLSEQKIFSISDETKAILESLNKDVEIIICNDREKFIALGEYFIQANEVINKYAQASPRIKVRYVDILRNPVFKNNYPDLQLTSTTVIVSSGDKHTDLTPYELYNIQQDYFGNEQIVSSKAEQAMTSAILKVASGNTASVAVIAGHDEFAVGGLTSLLSSNSFEVLECNLLTEEIADGVKLAIMCAPSRDLTEDEIAKLDAFLERGGTSLFYLAADVQAESPYLDAFLADWGVSVEGGMVYESSDSRAIQGNSLLAIPDYNEPEISASVIDKGMITLIPYSRPLKILFESKNGVTVTAPLMFSQSAGIIPPDADETWTPSDLSLAGPLPALTMSQAVSFDGAEPSYSTVLVSGSFLAVEDSYIMAPSIGNGEYFMNFINSLTGREDALSMQTKTIGGHELGIESSAQAYGFLLLFMILIPLAILIWGVTVWVTRRHR